MLINSVFTNSSGNIMFNFELFLHVPNISNFIKIHSRETWLKHKHKTNTKGGFMKQLRTARKKETCSEADHDSLLEQAFLKSWFHGVHERSIERQLIICTVGIWFHCSHKIVGKSCTTKLTSGSWTDAFLHHRIIRNFFIFCSSSSSWRYPFIGSHSVHIPSIYLPWWA
jgi:hypothetical protein